MNWNPDQYGKWLGDVSSIRTQFEEAIKYINDVKNDISANGWKGSSSQNFYNNIDGYIENLNNMKKSFEGFVENVNTNFKSFQMKSQGWEQGI